MHGSVSCHPGDVRGFRTDIKRNEATFSNFVIRAQKETKTITAFFLRGRDVLSRRTASHRHSGDLIINTSALISVRNLRSCGATEVDKPIWGIHYLSKITRCKYILRTTRAVQV